MTISRRLLLASVSVLPLRADAQSPEPMSHTTGVDPAGGMVAVLQDSFIRHPDGPLAEIKPSIGNPWMTTGEAPTVIVHGAATSTATGYAFQQFTQPPNLLQCVVSLHGSDPTVNTMTQAWDRNADLLNLVHPNFGPQFISVTLRQQGGDFESVLYEQWDEIVPFGERAEFSFALSGDTLTIHGPHGEVFQVIDKRIPDILGNSDCWAFWEPNAYKGNQARMYEVSAYLTPDSA